MSAQIFALAKTRKKNSQVVSIPTNLNCATEVPFPPWHSGIGLEFQLSGAASKDNVRSRPAWSPQWGSVKNKRKEKNSYQKKAECLREIPVSNSEGK